MLNYIAGVVIAFGIGFGCRWFGIPLPAPPSLLGVLLIFSITAGYLAADRTLR
ncbi:MAG: XapX domain-containing protein [Acidobacteria bacterium]|nr:XapX domain-containing protein [Acidobacteriota bacterium]